MYAKPLFLVAAILSARVTAQDSDSNSDSSCPQIWGTVANQLRDLFGDCNSAARQAIRLPFHDCFAGACDGSIILSDECTARPENTQLVPICQSLASVAEENDVGVADLIQVAAAVAVVACPPGPTIQVKVGRADVSEANPEGQIPSRDATAAGLVDAFRAKGLSVQDLVALTGSHSAGVDRDGTPLDTTIDSLDSPTYYSETLNDTAPTSLPSDHNLATGNQTADNWRQYENSQQLWNDHFAIGMEKMAVIGVDNEDDLIDCTSVIFGSD